jgi:hypothetical protein
MTRTILDPDLTPWEVFAAVGRRGGPVPARIVFRRADDPTIPALAFTEEAGLAAAEARVASAGDRELLELLVRAEPLR